MCGTKGQTNPCATKDDRALTCGSEPSVGQVGFCNRGAILCFATIITTRVPRVARKRHTFVQLNLVFHCIIRPATGNFVGYSVTFGESAMKDINAVTRSTTSASASIVGYDKNQTTLELCLVVEQIQKP